MMGSNKAERREWIGIHSVNLDALELGVNFIVWSRDRTD